MDHDIGIRIENRNWTINTTIRVSYDTNSSDTLLIYYYRILFS